MNSPDTVCCCSGSFARVFALAGGLPFEVRDAYPVRAMDTEAGRLDVLMQRYAQGEASVFTQLYKCMAPRVYRFCLRITNRKPEADDVFQETFMRIHRARATYIAGANPIYWAFAIARSVHLDRLRYRRRRPEELGSSDDVALQATPGSGAGACPEAEVRARAILHRLNVELEKMSEKNRIAYVLLREEGLSVKEAAAIVGTSTDVVKQRAHRAYEQIRNSLSAAGWRESSHDSADRTDSAWNPLALRI